ncbi:DUF488 family protein [Halotia branconii]|uniref:DUF488 family protein n=1 Tax=Halotia branconii CENA392 TaxID=1539056 RepID=A0AAJ6NYS7_9CYAN|nr:DUF488 family protein [Halotia branconii]WGV29117.1 DUF488 family protein [Halotia branconii CENA392]
MTIYTSYYSGIIKGEAVSISLYPPKNWKGKHLPLFAPTPELLKWWKSSAKDAAAQQKYKRQFHEILLSRQQLIDLWVQKQRESSADITLCCYEKTGDFCHRHQVGEEIVQAYLPEYWGGEIGAAQKPQLKIIPGGKFSPNATYPSRILNLIEKCHQSGCPVVCDRLDCGYYRVSLRGESLGVWSELGLLGVLSGLRQEFYRERLVPSISNPNASTKVETISNRMVFTSSHQVEAQSRYKL